MLSDALFVLGVSVLLAGLVRGHAWVAVAGIALAMLGRQTALPVALAAAAWVLLVPVWHPRRRAVAAALVLVPLGLYALLHLVSSPFSQPREAGIDDLTILGSATSAHELGRHLGLVVLGIAVPVGLVVGARLRTGAPLPVGPLLVAGAIVAQPLLLGPLANRSNEPRLAGLAVPALAVAAGMLLRHAELTRTETLVCAAAIAAGGLHHRYTWVGPAPNAGWALVELAAAAVVLVVLAWPAFARRKGSVSIAETDRAPG
jgi:hypothetical protein